MTLSEAPVRNIITKLISGEDYRIEVITLLNASFLDYVISFFKRIVGAKLSNEDITIDWYKKELLNDELTKTEIAIHSGLNMKTIGNMYNTTSKEIVIEASNAHYNQLCEAIQSLIDEENELNVTITLKFNQVSVDLNVNESLIVINTLAVKRSALSGGYWSTAGKQVEKPLMLTLCKLYGVSDENYKTKVRGREESRDDFKREIDFYISDTTMDHKCEVKLMGKGNPESADVVIARESKVFIADKLSDTNKSQLNSLGVEWVEMRAENGYKRFKTVLENLNIPHRDFTEDPNTYLEIIFNEIFETD